MASFFDGFAGPMETRTQEPRNGQVDPPQRQSQLREVQRHGQESTQSAVVEALDNQHHG